MTTHDADQTTLHEDLIAKIVVESLTQSPCDEDSHLPSWAYLAARTILAEFPEIGQPPQTTLHVPASDLPPRFTPSDTHIRAGLVDIGQQPSIDPALRERIDHHINLVMNLRFEAGELYGKGEDWDPTKRQCDLAVKHLYSLIESIAPAAQPQIDREELAWVLYGAFVNRGLGRNKTWMTETQHQSYLREADAAIAHLNAAPAAQPLPTRSELANVLDGGRTRKWDHFVGKLIAAGYATEDEPEPNETKRITGRDIEECVSHNLITVPMQKQIARRQAESEPEPEVDCDKCKGEPMTTNSGYVSIATETVERLIGIVRDYAEHTEDEHGYSFPVGIAKQIIEELQVALNGGNWWNGDRP